MNTVSSIIDRQREALLKLENSPGGFDPELARLLLGLLRELSAGDALFVKPREEVEREPVGALLNPAPMMISAYLSNAIVGSERAPKILDSKDREFLAALDFSGPVTYQDFNWFLNFVTAFLAKEEAERRTDAIKK